MEESKNILSNQKVQVDLPIDTNSTGKLSVVVDDNNVLSLLPINTADGADAFDGSRPMSVNIAALKGKIPGGDTIGEVLEAVLYPALDPTASIQANKPAREMGADTTVNLTWSARKTSTHAIKTVIVNGALQAPGITSGTIETNTLANTDTKYSIKVSTGTEAAEASTEVTYRHYRYWFTSAVDLLSLTDIQISDYLKSVVTYKEFATDKIQPARLFAPNNEFIYFSYSDDYELSSFKSEITSKWKTKLFNYINSENYVSPFRIYQSGEKLISDYKVTVTNYINTTEEFEACKGQFNQYHPKLQTMNEAMKWVLQHFSYGNGAGFPYTFDFNLIDVDSEANYIEKPCDINESPNTDSDGFDYEFEVELS